MRVGLVEEVRDIHTLRVDRVSLALLLAGETHARNRVCDLPPSASFSRCVSFESLSWNDDDDDDDILHAHNHKSQASSHCTCRVCGCDPLPER